MLILLEGNMLETLYLISMKVLDFMFCLISFIITHLYIDFNLWLNRLNSEWNSSPVKMAKADRRYFRKHRGWKRALLCCRF